MLIVVNMKEQQQQAGADGSDGDSTGVGFGAPKRRTGRTQYGSRSAFLQIACVSLARLSCFCVCCLCHTNKTCFKATAAGDSRLTETALGLSLGHANIVQFDVSPTCSMVSNYKR
jgi:hypothetical protein